MQIESCTDALRKLESAEHFKLPKARMNSGKRSPVRLEVSVPKAVNVPEEVNQIESLKLDRYNKVALSKKAIYLYPLVTNFKDQLDIAPDPDFFPPSPLGISEGLETEHWSEQEFGGALLGNTRLRKS